MGTIVYSNLVELLLEEGDKTEKEIINETIKRFEIPEEQIIKIKLQLDISQDYFQKQKNGKYHLLKRIEDGIFGRKVFLETLNKAPAEYLKERPWIQKLKEALEKKVL